MRSILALILSTLLCGQLMAQSQAPSSPAETLRRYPAGSRVELETSSGEHVRGSLVSVEPEGFTLKIGRSQPARKFSFAETRSVQARKPRTPVVAWIVAGAVVGVVVIAVAVLLIERHNEGGI